MRSKLSVLLLSILFLEAAGVFLEACSTVHSVGVEPRMVLSRF